MLADLVLASGLPFERVVQFTPDQLMEIQRAIHRQWKMMSVVNREYPLRASRDADKTMELEARVSAMKQTTGRTSFDLWEVVNRG